MTTADETRIEAVATVIMEWDGHARWELTDREWDELMQAARLALAAADAASPASDIVFAWMLARGYASGHGDTVEDMLAELEAQAKERGASPASTEDKNSLVQERGSLAGSTSRSSEIG